MKRAVAIAALVLMAVAAVMVIYVWQPRGEGWGSMTRIVFPSCHVLRHLDASNASTVCGDYRGRIRIALDKSSLATAVCPPQQFAQQLARFEAFNANATDFGRRVADRHATVPLRAMAASPGHGACVSIPGRYYLNKTFESDRSKMRRFATMDDAWRHLDSQEWPVAQHELSLPDMLDLIEPLGMCQFLLPEHAADEWAKATGDTDWDNLWYDRDEL